VRLSVADLVVVVVAIFAAHRGWRRGLLAQAFELGGGFLGLLAGVALGPRIAAPFAEEAGIEAALLSLLAVVLGLSVGQGLGYVIGHRFGHAARKARLGGLDSGLGALFGAFVILVSYWLIGSLLVEGPIRSVARSLKHSALLRAMNEVSAPPDVLAYLRQYLVAADFPQVFVGIPPNNDPVPLPRGRLVRRAIRAADQSTVRIMTPTPQCGGNQLGSGWIAGETTVITNAHVVAGGKEISVFEGATSHEGNVVLFDPATDIAVIRVDELDGPALELSTEPLGRGTRGAVLGYPGSRGGQLATGAAAVQARFQAVGRDIYGSGTVRREVYELRAAVEEGESGGPFVRPDGRVAGTVFAASTTDATVGYALTGNELADEVARGARTTGPVSTGDCTR
jgi:S1-C subfamily serine protease